MLELKNLTKTFDRIDAKPVVNQLNLAVHRGQVFGFLGPNGAGKTTTVKMIAGLLFPTEGEVTIGSNPAGSLAAKRIIGFMPEQPQFHKYLRAREVLELVGQLFDLPPKRLAKNIPQLLELVGLDREAELGVRKFSKGMHQRLAFATALINDPELLVLDEPLDGLDPLGRLDFKRLMLKLKSEGRTIFFSSHILADAEELCDEIALLNKGEIIIKGSPKQLTSKTKETLEEFFVRTIRND